MKFTISKKIGLGFGIIIAIMLLVNFLTLSKIKSLNDLQNIGTKKGVDAIAIAEAKETGAKVYQMIANLEINGVNAETLKEWNESFELGRATLQETLVLVHRSEDTEALTKAQTALDTVGEIVNKKMLPLLKNSSTITQEVKDLDSAVDKEIEVIEKNYEFVTKQIILDAHKADQDFDDVSAKVRSALVIGIIMAALIAIILTLIISRMVNVIVRSLNTEIDKLLKATDSGDLKIRGNENAINFEFKSIVTGFNKTLDTVVAPVNEAVSVLQKMETGDLSGTMKGEYMGDYATIKNALNSSLKAITHTLGEVANSVYQVNSGSEQVASASQSLSKGATEQAGALQQVSSSMNEIEGQTKKNAENASQARALSDTSQKNAGEGNLQMQKMIQAMSDINNSSEKISKIIKVIDEIAFQTNLLALNAAVEAARAGKHGKGFAVVAEEVRNLAARSAKAAKETTEMIGDSLKKVEDGSKIANETATALDAIVTGTTKVTDLVNEIAAASVEQAESVAQIVKALSQIDQVTQRNTASAEESASAAEELSNQAVQLSSAIERFKLS